jgi:hypothetical protein
MTFMCYNLIHSKLLLIIMSTKLLIYSFEKTNSTAVVKTIKIMGIPANLTVNSIDEGKLQQLLISAAKLELQDKCDFITFDIVKKSISTQCFIDFTQDSTFKVLRISDLDSPNDMIFSIIQDLTPSTLPSIDYNTLALT